MTTMIPYGSNAEQFGELRLPEGYESRPLVILVHGGFWRDQYQLDLMHPLAEALSKRGFPSWNIEYRRVGPTGGGYPTTLHDVGAAIDHVSQGHEFSTQTWPAIAVIGHSAGGHLVLWNASRVDAVRRPDLTVGLAPVADVVTANRKGIGKDATANFFGGDADDVPDRYQHAQPDPTQFAGRVVLIHGDNDDSVPLAQSQGIGNYVDRLEVLEGGDHFVVIDPEHHSWQIVFEELEGL